MKTMLATLFIATLTLTYRVALAQDAPPTALPAPEEAAVPGVAPRPAATEPAGTEVVPEVRAGGGGGGGTGGAQGGVFDIPRVFHNPYSPPTATYGSATVIQFSQPDPQGLEAMQEDLNVMSLLLQRKLEDAVGENSPTYKMGIPLLLRSGQRSIESLYLDGFGALFAMTVNFPLVPPPASKAKENESATGSDDWDKARKELYGGREAHESGNPWVEAVPYDADQVGALKRAVLEALKNAANIRALKPDESAVVTVFGTESVPVAVARVGGGARGDGGAGGGIAGTPPAERDALEAYWRVIGSESSHGHGRGTVLTVRVKKSDAEAFAQGKISFDQFQQKTIVNAYIGPAKPGVSGTPALGDLPVLPARVRR